MGSQEEWESDFNPEEEFGQSFEEEGQLDYSDVHRSDQGEDDFDAEDRSMRASEESFSENSLGSLVSDIERDIEDLPELQVGFKDRSRMMIVGPCNDLYKKYEGTSLVIELSNLSKDTYSENYKNQICLAALNNKDIGYLNARAFIMAFNYLSTYKTMSPETFKEYIKGLGKDLTVPEIDVLRYTFYLSKT